MLCRVRSTASRPSSISRGMGRSSRGYTSLSADYKFPKNLLNTPVTTVSTLKNGLMVATEPSFGPTCTVGVYINSGSVYETKKTNGAAHFLEHLAFKGTTRRSQEQIELEVENMGGHLNAYTSREMTAYYAKCLSSDAPKAVDILSDLLQNSKLASEAIDRERSVILREAVEVESTPEEVIFEHLHSVAYQGTSHAFTILGPEENIQSLKREDLLDYIKTHYTAPRMLVAAAGDIKHEELVRLAETHFGNLPSQATGPAALAPAFTGSAVTIRNDELPAAHVALAFEGAPYSDPDYFVFLVMQTLLGSWDRNLGSGKNLISRLAEEISAESLAHSYSAFNTPYHKTSLFGLYAVASPDTLDDLAYAMVKSMVRLSTEVTEAETERARNKLKASLLMSLDGTHAVCEEMGRQLLGLGRRMSTAEIFMRIDMVTAKEVKRVAQEYIYDNEIALAAMGPIKNLPDYGVIRGWTYWNRT